MPKYATLLLANSIIPTIHNIWILLNNKKSSNKL